MCADTEVSGETENVVEVTAESGEAGKIMDLTGVAIEVLCGLGELGKAGEMKDTGQTGEPSAAVCEVSQVTGELGVPGIVAGKLGEGGVRQV